jgi:hypothetical protein
MLWNVKIFGLNVRLVLLVLGGNEGVGPEVCYQAALRRGESAPRKFSVLTLPSSLGYACPKSLYNILPGLLSY